MTFAVVSVGKEQEKVVGTIWAQEESQAQLIASSLCSQGPNETVVVRRTEDREIPLKLSN